MKLAYVTRTFPKLSETFVLREVQELVRRGDNVEVWSLLPPDPREPPVAGASEVADVIRCLPAGARRTVSLTAAVVHSAMASPSRFAATLAWGARWSWRERDPRHLAAFPFAAWLARSIAPGAHLHAHFANTPATTALMAASLAGLRCSFTGHARDIFVVTSPRFLREKIRRATFVAVGTEFAAERLRRIVGPAAAHKVVVIRNGLHLSPRPDIRRNAGFTICSVGRLVPKKGFPTLIHACALLRDEGIYFRCEIVGDGPQRKELEALVAAERLQDHVKLLGALDSDAVRDALHRSTVFALPCREMASGDVDTMPLSILEAMEAGVPPVTSTVGGIPELVESEVSGLLVPPESPDALAEALVRVLRDRLLRERLGAGARDAVERFDVPSNVERLTHLFARPPGP